MDFRPGRKRAATGFTRVAPALCVCCSGADFNRHARAGQRSLAALRAKDRGCATLWRMDDRTPLLEQLRLDPSARATRAPTRRRRLLIALPLLLLAILFGARLLQTPLQVETYVVPAAPSGPPSVLDASGYVVARRQATVSSKVTGKVVEVHLEEGRQVAAGEVLARIDDSNVRAQLALAEAQESAARAQLKQLEVQLAEASRQLTRQQRLAEREVIAAQTLDTAQARVDSLRAQLEAGREQVKVAQRQVELQQRALDDTIVRAPFAGVITVKNAQPGEMISPLSAGGAGTRTGIGTLVDMESLEIEVDVNENFINRVAPGQPATARLNAYPDWNIPTRVIAVIPSADRSKATVKVRLAFEHKDPRLLPEMGVRVAFHASNRPAAVVAGVAVPASVVQQDNGSARVYVIEEGRARARPVQLGAQEDGQLQVLSGVRAGDALIVIPAEGLREGQRVRAAADA